jgi:hypothetical protein
VRRHPPHHLGPAQASTRQGRIPKRAFAASSNHSNAPLGQESQSILRKKLRIFSATLTPKRPHFRFESPSLRQIDQGRIALTPHQIAQDSGRTEAPNMGLSCYKRETLNLARNCMMYNLFVAYNLTAWLGKPYEMQLGRALTYTAEPLKAKYGALDDEMCQALQSFPALFVNEKQHNAPGHIGWIAKIRHRNKEARIEYEIDQNLPAIPMDKLLELQWELDFTEWEMNTTHWALKDVDLFPVLIEAGLVTADMIAAQPTANKIRAIDPGQTAAEIEARPSVFRVPKEPKDSKLVSVMMPFSPAFSGVYAAIKKAAEAAGMTCERADNIWEENEVIQDIFSLIYRSSIVVCDFTQQNPNVFYEAGIAHTLGRSVIPISQNDNDVPFDLKHHRYLKYLNNGEGLDDLVKHLTSRLKTLSGRL